MAFAGDDSIDRLPACEAGADGNVRRDPEAGGKTLFTSDIDILDVVDFPCMVDDETLEFLRSHGRVFFLSRGPPGTGKGTVASELQRLYPESRIYWSDKLFLSPMAPQRTRETLKQSHELCQSKIEAFMKENVPVIINRNTNMTVWEISPYLFLAAKYGYTTIILNIDKNLEFKPQVLAITNSKGLDQAYMQNRLKMFDQVYPFATGWCPRPRDAARLLRRYRELAAELAAAENGGNLMPIKHTQIFPFCLARICQFGWRKQDREYFHSEAVAKAYGSKDTITVLGYAVLDELVVAVVHLSEAQALLAAGNSEEPPHLNAMDRDDKDDDDEALANAFGRRVNVQECDEVRCVLDLDDVAMPGEDLADEEEPLEEAPAYSELPPSPQVSFIVLGFTAEPMLYSEAVRTAAVVRADNWRDAAAADVGAAKVYGKSYSHCIVLDEKAVKMDTVFTGYYQSHTTRSSGRCPTWSTSKRGVPRGGCQNWWRRLPQGSTAEHHVPRGGRQNWRGSPRNSTSERHVASESPQNWHGIPRSSSSERRHPRGGHHNWRELPRSPATPNAFNRDSHL